MECVQSGSYIFHFCLTLDKINKNFNLKCKNIDSENILKWFLLQLKPDIFKIIYIIGDLSNVLLQQELTHNCFLSFIGGTYKRRSGGMAPPFEPRRRKINSSPLFSHPASRMVNLQARLHSGEKLRRQQEKQIAVPMTILHGMGGLRTGEGVGTERP